MYLSSAQALEITTTALGTLSPPPDEDDPTSARASRRWSCAPSWPGCGCSTACRSPTWCPTASCCRPSRSASSTSTAPGPTRWCRARSASARSPPPTARSSRRSTRTCATRSTRRSARPAPRRRGRPAGAGGTVSGFLLRSRAVSGWPGLHVRAYRDELGQADDATIPESDPGRLKVLRMERLAPAVLLVLFDGVPAVVHIEEPRQGIQFGVRLLPRRRAQRLQGRGGRARRQHGGRRRPQDARRRAVPAGRARRARSAAPQRQAACTPTGPTWGPRSTAPSSRCRCCASRTARCSATRRWAARRRSTTSSARPRASPQLKIDFRSVLG